MDSNHILGLKKFIKQEQPIERLASLKLPRDLTLSGSAAPRAKKQFAPNLNVTRNKTKAKEVLKKNEPNHKARKVSNNIHDRRKDRFIQSSGIFSTGFNSDIKRASGRFSSERRSDKEVDGSNSLPMPTIKIKNWEVDTKNESSVFEDLIGCDEDMIDEKVPFEPVSLLKKKPEAAIKSEIKTEFKTEETIGCEDASLKKLNINSDFNEYFENEMYDDYNPAFSLWNMPDSMCGKGLSDDPNCKEIFDYSLNNMPEGKIGKLVIRKSGKMEVHIGNIKYALDTSNLEAYKEHVVSLDMKSEKGSAATVLGQIKNRYNLYPNWNSLLG